MSGLQSFVFPVLSNRNEFFLKQGNYIYGAIFRSRAKENPADMSCDAEINLIEMLFLSLMNHSVVDQSLGNIVHDKSGPNLLLHAIRKLILPNC